MKKNKNLPMKKKDNKPAKVQEIDMSSVSKLVLRGDLSGLSEKEKLEYYGALCKSLNLNPMLKPFDYITFVRDGKQFEMLYATKSCAEQLRKIHGISVIETTRTITDEYVVYDVTVQDSTGRTDTGTGVVSLIGRKRDGGTYKLSGTAYADAIMKAETKAKRRATLSISGLGMLDETELDFVYKNNEIEHKPADNNEIKQDVMRRQVMIDKFKQLPQEIRKKFADKKLFMDDALEFCEKHGWDVSTITVALEVDDVKEEDNPF